MNYIEKFNEYYEAQRTRQGFQFTKEEIEGIPYFCPPYSGVLQSTIDLILKVWAMQSESMVFPQECVVILMSIIELSVQPKNIFDTTQTPILFYEPTDPYGEFSNFYEYSTPVQIKSKGVRPKKRKKIILNIKSLFATGDLLLAATTNGRDPQGPSLRDDRRSLNGMNYITSEHYFQAQKFIGVDGSQRKTYGDLVGSASTAGKSAYLARQKTKGGYASKWYHSSEDRRTLNDLINESKENEIYLRTDWSRVKDRIMYDIVYQKFIQNPELQQVLLATGDRILVEHTPRDPYWGDGAKWTDPMGSGRNQLGKTLMLVRQKIRDQQTSTGYTYYHEVMGDATTFSNPNDILAHGCSYRKLWGKGFVLAVNKTFGLKPKNSYIVWEKNKLQNDYDLGAVQFVDTPKGIVANMITQKSFGRGSKKPPLRYEAVEKALNTVFSKASENGVNVHMPRIGAGLGGGNWNKIKNIIQNMTETYEVNVYVYEYEF